MVSSKRDFEVRRAQAWQACKRMDWVWESNVSRNIKVCLCQATVETVLLYGAAAWSLTKGMEKALDGIYMHPTTKVCPRDQMARSPD